jgi:hypothetical protein
MFSSTQLIRKTDRKRKKESESERKKKLKVRERERRTCRGDAHAVK